MNNTTFARIGHSLRRLFVKQQAEQLNQPEQVQQFDQKAANRAGYLRRLQGKSQTPARLPRRCTLRAKSIPGYLRVQKGAL